MATDTPSDPLLVARDGPLCTLTINNPAKRNAVSPDCLAAIAETCTALADDDTLRAVVLRGAGDQAFSSGADLSPPSTSPRRTMEHPDPYEAIRRLPVPTIAMLYGHTLGAGCMLAMACDLRLAAASVRIGIPTARMGLVLGTTTYRRFLDVLGYATTVELFLTGRTFAGAECLQRGMVNSLVDADQLEQRTRELVEDILRCAPLAVRGAKRVIDHLTTAAPLDPVSAAACEALRQQAAASADHAEAKAAFRSKRPPVFQGR